MNNIIQSILITAIVSFPAFAFGGLFDEEAPLKVEIQADFSQLEKERNKENKYPGHLIIDNLELPIALNVRGNNRLKKKTCTFSPLKIDFKKSEARKQSVFHKQGDLKLVVLCKKKSAYKDYLRKEYLVYKMLNVLTPLSYRVRWVDVTYKDGNQVLGQRPAFLVEHKKRVAKRNHIGLDQPTKEIFYEDLEPTQATLVEQFQYFVGNTDYSLLRSGDPRDCCHNAKLLSEKEIYTPIIYDFDATGLVSTSYATPASGLKISNVRKRLFRGYCLEEPAMQKARQQILNAKDQILSIITTDSKLSKGGTKKTLRYVSESFEHFSSDKLWNANIREACRAI